MAQICVSMPEWLHALVFIFLFLAEAILGKTKYGSTIGLILKLIQKLLTKDR